MYRFLLIAVCMASISSVRGAEVRTWTDETGKYKIEAKLSGTEDGKIKLTKKDAKVVKIVADKLSDADQEYLNKQLEAWNAKRTSHTIWRIKMPEIKFGVSTETVMGVAPSGNVHTPNRALNYSIPSIQSGTYQVTYSYKGYGYQPVKAQLVSYKGNDVTLRNDDGEGTFKYGNFADADQKFLNEYRSMEKEAGSLNEVDLPRSYSSTDSTQLAGQYDLGNGQTVSINPNGILESSHWGSGTWVYDEEVHRHHIHWSNGRDVYIKPSSKGNLHIKD